MTAAAPVLVVGSGRSGTTFLAKLLDSHPRVVYLHEPDSVLVDAELPFLPASDELEAYRARAGRYLERLEAVRTPKVYGHTPVFDKRYRSALGKQIFRLGVYAAKGVERAGLGRGALVLAPASPLPRHDPDSVVVIKSVNSLGRARLFSLAVPGLRVLHIVRHPAAVVASRLRGIHKGVMGARNYIDSLFDAGYGDGYGWSREALKAASFEEQATFEWMAVNQRVYTEMRGSPRYRLVHYEHLCQRLEATARELFADAGLSWEPQSQAFIRSLEAAPAEGAGYFGVVRPPTSALARWREELGAEQVRRIEETARRCELGRMYFEPERSRGEHA